MDFALLGMIKLTFLLSPPFFSNLFSFNLTFYAQLESAVLGLLGLELLEERLSRYL